MLPPPPDISPPSACPDMARLRQAIDGLDAHLVALLAVRQKYIERAALLKQARDAVRDEARIDDVLAKVKAAAACEGLDLGIAEAVWRALVEGSIAHEFRAFDAKDQAAR